MTDQPSSADFVQASRVLKVKSPLGDDQLLPERLVINEGVSQLFEIQLNVRAKKESVKPEELIGRLIDVSVEVQQGDGEEGGQGGTGPGPGEPPGPGAPGDAVRSGRLWVPGQ